MEVVAKASNDSRRSRLNGEAGSPTPRKWPKSRYLDDKPTNCRASSQAPQPRPTHKSTFATTSMDVCEGENAGAHFLYPQDMFTIPPKGRA